MNIPLALGVSALLLLTPTSTAQTGSLILGNVRDVAVDSADSKHLAVLWSQAVSTNVSIQESTNGGQTFSTKPVPSRLRPRGLEISSQGELWIYGHFDSPQDGTMPLLYRHDGTSWTPLSLPPLGNPTVIGFRTVTSLVRSDVDPEAWFLSRSLQSGSTQINDLLYSLDDGATWMELDPSPPGTNQLGSSAHTITRDSAGLRFAVVRSMGTTTVLTRELVSVRANGAIEESLGVAGGSLIWIAPPLGDGIEYRRGTRSVFTPGFPLSRRSSVGAPWVDLSSDDRTWAVAGGRFDPDLLVRARSSTSATTNVDSVEVSRDGGSSWTEALGFSEGSIQGLTLGSFDDAIYLRTSFGLYGFEIGGVVGDTECAAAPNSTGTTGELFGSGQDSVAANDLRLVADRLPSDVTTLFIVSRTAGFVPGAGGSMGNLCLSGTVGRYQGSVGRTSLSGERAIDVNLNAIPQASTFDTVIAGETWRFQAWHRDQRGSGVATSNFTHSLAITFTP